MRQEPIYVLSGIRCGFTQSGHTDLSGEEALVDALERVHKPHEAIFTSLSQACHSDSRLRDDTPPHAASIVFINFSLPGADIPHEIQYVRRHLTCAVFVLYASDEDFVRCTKELPKQWSAQFERYFLLRKPKGGFDSGFEDEVRGILDQAAAVTLRKKERAGRVNIRKQHFSDSAKPIPNIADHELIRRIGIGSYGEVWLARNILGTYRAVKVIYRKRFVTERPYEREFLGIKTYEPISRTHDGLVDILQIGRDDGTASFYYVMELADDAEAAHRKVQPPASLLAEIAARSQGTIEGPATVKYSDVARKKPASDLELDPETYQPRTLRSEINRHGSLPVGECITIGLSVASALSHLHKHGLVHRDIKPSNIVFANGMAKLADIGLVAHVSEAHSFVGTEGFIPPEGPGTAQADLYSLGKVLYELCTGNDRLKFPDLAPAVDSVPDRAALLRLNSVILRACEHDPHQRYQTAEELQADLR